MGQTPSIASCELRPSCELRVSVGKGSDPLEDAKAAAEAVKDLTDRITEGAEKFVKSEPVLTPKGQAGGKTQSDQDEGMPSEELRKTASRKTGDVSNAEKETGSETGYTDEDPDSPGGSRMGRAIGSSLHAFRRQISPESDGSTPSFTRRQFFQSMSNVADFRHIASLDSSGNWYSDARSKCGNFVKEQITIQDHGPLPVGVIIMAFVVAVTCGIAAWSLHLGVFMAGCLSGLNGCKERLLLDWLQEKMPFLSDSMYFVITSCLSGLACSFVLNAPSFVPWNLVKVGKKCKGGGSAGSKIVVGAGQRVSGFVAPYRILLAAIYLGGGNPLGTEGPIIHMSAAFATFQIGVMGIKSRKMLSMFAVVGSAAGMSAGFGVLLTGFIFTIEELTRSLSQKSALIITLAAGLATLTKERCDYLFHIFVHVDHGKLAPYKNLDGESYWDLFTSDDATTVYFLCVPIGIASGLAGWVFVRVAWTVQVFFRSGKGSRLPERTWLALMGIVSGVIGVLVFEIVGVNGVWGTTVGTIPEVLHKDLEWHKTLLMWLGKFVAFTLATAVGGPGGSLVPSLASGGLMGISIAKLVGLNEQSVAACAVVGMGSQFASVMHLPVTGVIMVYELTWAKQLIIHVIIANFVSMNVMSRLPHGEESFVHRALHHDPVWLKLGGQDFIETDAQATVAFYNEGIGKITQFNTHGLRWWLLTNHERLRLVFVGWHKRAQGTGEKLRRWMVFLESHKKSRLDKRLTDVALEIMRMGFNAFLANSIEQLKQNGGRRKDVRFMPQMNDIVPQWFSACMTFGNGSARGAPGLRHRALESSNDDIQLWNPSTGATQTRYRSL